MNRLIRIMGGTLKIRDVDELLQKIFVFSQHHQVCVQVLNARVVFGKEHLLSAAEHAIRAMRQNRNTMNSLAMEVLLYASGERQIKLGIKKMGVTKGAGEIAVVLIESLENIPEAKGTVTNQSVERFLKSLGFVRDDKVLEGDMDTLKKFGVTKKELQTVPEVKYGHLILEKIAMVDVIK